MRQKRSSAKRVVTNSVFVANLAFVGTASVQRLGATINIQRNSNNKVTKNIITQVTYVTNHQFAI